MGKLDAIISILNNEILSAETEKIELDHEDNGKYLSGKISGLRFAVKTIEGHIPIVEDKEDSTENKSLQGIRDKLRKKIMENSF